MIYLSAAVGIALNFLLGYSLTKCFFTGTVRNIEPVSRVAMIYLTGQCLGSMTYWVWLLLGMHVKGTWIILDLIVAAVFLMLGKHLRSNKESDTKQEFYRTRFNRLRLGVWLLMLCLAVIISWAVSWHNAKAPYGYWDAAAMWNYKVSYMAGPEKNWINIIRSMSAHPDYPLLHSISATRLCALTGQWQPQLTCWFSLMQALLMLVILVGAIMDMVSEWVALLVGVLFYTTEAFWKHTSWQYADVTLSCYMLAGLAMWCRWYCLSERKDTLLLYWSILLIGTCAWVKNEGWPWVVIMTLLTVFVIVFAMSQGRIRRLVMIGLCLVVVLWMPLSVHLMVQQNNDILNAVLHDRTYGQIADGSRFEVIVMYLSQYIIHLYPWGMIVMLFLACMIIRTLQPRSKRSNVWWLMMLMFAGQFAVYILVYMLTHHDLKWHLHTSGQRVLLHIWPIFLLAIGLIPASKMQGGFYDRLNGTSD
jgi:hypothetical protein